MTSINFFWGLFMLAMGHAIFSTTTKSIWKALTKRISIICLSELKTKSKSMRGWRKVHRMNQFVGKWIRVKWRILDLHISTLLSDMLLKEAQKTNRRSSSAELKAKILEFLSENDFIYSYFLRWNLIHA